MSPVASPAAVAPPDAAAPAVDAHVGNDLLAARARLDAAIGELAEQRRSTAAADARLVEAGGRLRAIRSELHDKDARLVLAELALAGAQRSAADAEAEVAEVLRDARLDIDADGLGLLAAAGDPQEYEDLRVLARSVRRAQEARLRDLANARAEAERTARALLRLRDDLARLEAAAAGEEAAAAAAQEAARTAEAELVADLAVHQAAVAGFERAREDEERRLADVERAGTSLSGVLAGLADSAATVTPGPADGSADGRWGYLSSPVDGRVSSPFGYREHPVLGGRRLHTGIDVASPCGTPLRAAADGRILSARDAGGYGNQVVVTHGVVGGTSLATVYNHLSSFAVTSGDVVRGQVIGYVGSTGMSTGCHLHLEAREAGTPVDPFLWLE